MNDEIYILDRPTVKIILNKNTQLFTVRILSNDDVILRHNLTNPSSKKRREKDDAILFP